MIHADSMTSVPIYRVLPVAMYAMIELCICIATFFFLPQNFFPPFAFEQFLQLRQTLKTVVMLI